MENDLRKVKISKERRKELRKALKDQLGSKKKIVYLSGFLSWLQFLMRIISFGIIAYGLNKLYHKEDLNLALYFGLILILNLSGFILSRIGMKYQGIPSQYARDNLKKKFLDIFVEDNQEFFKTYSSGDILTLASQGIDSLDTYYNVYLSTVLRTFLNCSSVLAIVLFIFPLGSMVFILSLPLIPISILLIQKRSEKIMERYWASYMDVGNLFMDDLKGLNTLYSYSADEIYEKEFNEKAENFRLSTMELLKFQLQSVGYMDGVMYLGISISGFLASIYLFKGNISLFSFIFFILIGAEFFTPIRELGYCMHLLMMNTKMADRIFSFLDSWEGRDEEVKSQDLGEINKLEIKNLSFSYGEKPLLDNINFTIEKGDFFSLAGESGLGKSTLAKILFKEIKDFQGDVLIDGKSIRDISRADLLASAFYLSPDSYLFNTSIYENLRMAKDLSKEEMLDWIKKKKILRYLDDLDQGIDTLVGENGNLISPGQRQQIICARALLANRQIYIFDEITSSVDSENEEDILDLIKIMSEQAIVILISHKMKQVSQADKVVFLGEKNRYYFDRPENLYKISSEYKKLFDLQEEMEAILYER